jgi:hypothetical protein
MMSNFLSKSSALILISAVLISIASCGKGTYGQTKKKFKAWGAISTHKEVI